MILNAHRVIKTPYGRSSYVTTFTHKQTGLIGGKGIGIQGLSSNALHKLLFPLPPLSEQYRIVEAIETVFAQLDSILTSVS